MAIVNENFSTEPVQGEKRRAAMVLEKPSRIHEDISSLSAAEKTKKFKQSAIEDILQTVKVRDAAIKERGEIKNQFKREV